MLTEEQKDRLNEFSDFLMGMRSVFEYPPEINRQIVLAYWDFANEVNVTLRDIENAFSKLAIKQTKFPRINDIKLELADKIDMNRECIKKYHFPSKDKVNSCNGNKGLITGRYLSGSLFILITENTLKEHIDSLLNEDMESFYYEVCFLKLHEQGIGIKKPEMKLNNLWTFAGLIKTDVSDFNIKEYIDNLAKKMGGDR